MINKELLLFHKKLQKNNFKTYIFKMGFQV